MNKHKKIVAFCPVCGQLEVKDGKIIHPEMDRIISDMLKNAGTVTNYTGDYESEKR